MHVWVFGHVDVVFTVCDDVCTCVVRSRLSDAEIEEILTKQEREAATTGGRDFAERVAGHKKGLALKMDRCAPPVCVGVLEIVGPFVCVGDDLCVRFIGLVC